MLFFLAFAHVLTLYVAHILTRNEIEVRIHVRGLQHENVRSSFKVISVKMSQKNRPIWFAMAASFTQKASNNLCDIYFRYKIATV